MTVREGNKNIKSLNVSLVEEIGVSNKFSQFKLSSGLKNDPAKTIAGIVPVRTFINQ